MKQNYSVLIIEDVPITCDAYRLSLEELCLRDQFLEFEIDQAYDCITGYEKIKNASKKNKIDSVFLDIKLPPNEEAKIYSGEDLGIKIRQILPKTKIVVFTGYSDNFRIHTIFKSLNPEGFLIKNDFTSKELLLALKTVLLDDIPYYSKTVLNLLRKQEVYSHFLLDKNDRQLLYELSMGTKIIEMSKKIDLAKPTIEKRFYRLKEIFDVKNRNELIMVAKEKGFI